MKNQDNEPSLNLSMETPAREKWLFSNPEVLKRIKQGLTDAAEGRVSERSSFKKIKTKVRSAVEEE